MKRLYVRPVARGQGLGRALAEHIVAEAKRQEYKRMLMDTLPSLKAAQALYLSMGFTRIAPYRFNPDPDTVFLQLLLE